MDYSKYGTVGKEIFNFDFIGTDKVYIQTTKGKIEKVTLPTNSDKPLLEMSRFLKSVYPRLTEEEIEAKKGTEWHAYNPGEAKVQEIEEAYKKYMAAKTAKVGVPAAAATLITILCLTGCPNKTESETNTNTNEQPTVEQTLTDANYDNGFNLDGVSADALVAALNSGTFNGQAINATQAQFLLDAYNFINNNAQQEAWEKVTLTDEELAEVNAQLKALGYAELDGNTVQFGYTYQQVADAMLRFRELPKEDILSITGGETIDVDNLMNDTSNEFIRSEIIRYLFSKFRNTEELNNDHYNVAELLNFNEKEVNAYNEINALIGEYNALVKEGKEKEAQEKMKEIENWLVDMAYNTEFDKGNLKPYALETIYFAASIESGLNQYKEETTITVYDTVTGRDVEIKIDRKYFDELEGAILVTGLDDFDAINYKKENKIADRYEIPTDSIGRGIANESCGEQRDRLIVAAEWIQELRNADLSEEKDWAMAHELDVTSYDVNVTYDNLGTEYDKYQNGTFKLVDVIEVMNEGLADKYPMNFEYYTTFRQLVRDYANGVTNADDLSDIPAFPGVGNIPGPQYIGTYGEGQHPAGLTDAQNAQLQAQAAAAVGAVTESQAAAYQGSLQSIYEAAYNYYFGQVIFQSAVTFDPAWLNLDDPFIIAAINDAKAQAEAEKHSSNGGLTGGGTVPVNQGLEQITDPTAPKPDNSGATQQEQIVNPNQDDIDNNMAHVEENTPSGNGTGGEVPSVPGDQTTTTTQTITADDVNNQPGAPQTNPGAVSTDQPAPSSSWCDTPEDALALLYSGDGNESYKSK